MPEKKSALKKLYESDDYSSQEYREVLELEAVIDLLKREFPKPGESGTLIEQYLRGRF